MTELLNLVSDKDEVIGTASREQVYRQKQVNFRTINGFVINDSYHLWIPQRQSSKELWPLMLDASVGGHVKSGESYENAFVREAHEELNLPLGNYQYQCLGKMTPLHHEVGSFMCIYAIFSNESPQFNTDDFISGEWYGLDDIIAQLRISKVGKPDLLPILEWIKLT